MNMDLDAATKEAPTLTLDPFAEAKAEIVEKKPEELVEEQAVPEMELTPEELEQWIKFLPAPEDDSSYFYFSDPDPYFKFERKPDEQRSSRWFNHDGHLTVRNHCAAALPKITVTLHSGQTTYRFGGSYDGSRSLSGKLLDRMAKDIEKEIENEYRVEQNSDLLMSPYNK